MTMTPCHRAMPSARATHERGLLRVPALRVGIAIAEFYRDWQLARYLKGRVKRRDDQRLIRRKSDGTLWTEGHPKNFAYAFAEFFGKGELGWHFYKVREWRGLLIASRKVFWMPRSGEFSVGGPITCLHLPRWPEVVECKKIDAKRAAQGTEAGTAETGTGSVHEGAGRKASPTPCRTPNPTQDTNHND